MVYKLSRDDDEFLNNAYNDAMVKLNGFFDKEWMKNVPRVFQVKDRKTINQLMGWDTPGYLVAWGGKPFDGTAYVYILDRKNYEKESDKEYSDEKYQAMLTHELTHCFIDSITDNYRKPAWLNEGIAEYLAGQMQWKKFPEKYGEFLSCFEKADIGAYREGCFVVRMLVEEYGKERLLELLKGVKEKRPDEDGFAKLFKEIYGWEVSYEEVNKRMIRETQKTSNQ